MRNKSSQKRLNKLLKLIDSKYIKCKDTQQETKTYYVKPTFVRG